MSDLDLNACELENKKWKCPVCCKILSRKQTLQNHLWGVHNEQAGPSSKKYKTYQTDETVSVPRSTRYRWSVKGKSVTTGSEPEERESISTAAINESYCDSSTQSRQDKTCDSDHLVDQSLQTELEQSSGIDPVSSMTDVHENITDVTDLPLETNVFPLLHTLDVINNPDEDMDIATSDCSDENTLDDSQFAKESTDTSLIDFDDADGLNKEDNMDNDCDNIGDDPPLYVIPTGSQPVSSPITVQEHLCAVGAFAARHNISDVAFKDLLSLLQLHIPKNNIGETRVQNVKARCGFGKDYLNFHMYCELCNKLYSGESELCLTPGCKGNKTTGSNVRYFTTSNLSAQLEEVLQREKVWELTRKHMNVEHKNICDIQGGQAYQELLKPGQFLHQSNNVTLSAFTDGVALFKSSGVQLWPVYLLINEIPPKERFHRKNMLLWGIWQGKGKPRMNMFLRPLVLDLLNLFHKGTDIVIKHEKIHVKAMLVVATMDLPARAYVTNMTQYNGKFGCLYCEDEGTVVKSGAGTCRAFLTRDEPAKQRTRESIVHCCLEAYKSGDRNMGFFGISVLSYLPQFSLSGNITIDYMHGVLLGITKKLLDYWFDARFCRTDFYIGDKTGDVDQQLLKIQPPYIIHRTPRSIKNTLKHWKASELRNWLLFYAIPCLTNILPNLYLKHFSVLVEATYILLTTGITSTDLEKAEQLLRAFHDNAQLLYGENFMGLNVHNLLHLVPMVKSWGPLWAWSCFPFESFNGELKKTIHGTGNVCRQVFWSFQAEKRILCEASKTNLKGDADARGYVEQLFHKQDGPLTCTDAHMCQVVLPKIKKKPVLSEEEERHIRALLPTDDNSGTFIKLSKVMRNGFVFSTKINSNENSKQNSYTFLLDPRMQQQQDVFAFEAEYFLLHEETMRVVCKGKYLKSARKVPGMAAATHIHVIKYGQKGVIKLESMMEPLIVMPMKNSIYCASFPNIYERD